MTSFRFPTLVLTASALLLLLAPSAGARTWYKERKIPARFTFASHVYDNGTRCASEFQLAVDPVPGAKSYRASYYDAYWKRVDTKVGPPFEHMANGDPLPSTNPARVTATTWALTGLHGPVPCESYADYAPRFSKPVAWALIKYSDKPDVVVGNVHTTGARQKTVAGVKIRVTGPSGRQTVTTDARGGYRVELDERGMHTVTAVGKRICLYQPNAPFTNFPCTKSKQIDSRGGDRHTVGFSKLSGYLVSGRVLCSIATRWDAIYGAPLDFVERPARSRFQVKVGPRTVTTDPATGAFAAELEGGRSYQVRLANADSIEHYTGLTVEPEQRDVQVADRDVPGLDFRLPAAAGTCGWATPPFIPAVT